ncbi:MAG TPA: hypothetical protein VEM96_05925 [Pyrinomonadaceae bacterium]|nr:hypothetical protein [Pyrinomonadaceae bacterium]
MGRNVQSPAWLIAEKLEGSTNPHETGTKNQFSVHLIWCDFVDRSLVFTDFQQLLTLRALFDGRREVKVCNDH